MNPQPEEGKAFDKQDWEGIAKTIILSIDHYREAGREDSFNVQSIADYLKRCFPPPAPIKTEREDEINLLKETINNQHALILSAEKRGYEKSKQELSAPPSPLGIDVETEAKKYAGIKVPLRVKDYSAATKRVYEAFKAGYAASPKSNLVEERVMFATGVSDLNPQSDRINQLESGIKNIINWLNEKRPHLAGIGAPVNILQGLLDGVNFDYSPQSSTSEEEKDLIIAGLEEGSELWKAEYDNCRAILTELVYLKNLKDSAGKTEEYEQRQPLIWITAKMFLEKYQHQ